MAGRILRVLGYRPFPRMISYNVLDFMTFPTSVFFLIKIDSLVLALVASVAVGLANAWFSVELEHAAGYKYWKGR